MSVIVGGKVCECDGGARCVSVMLGQGVWVRWWDKVCECDGGTRCVCDGGTRCVEYDNEGLGV